jgi:hypothetical protein
VGVYVANARQGRKYEKRTAKPFKRFGVKVYHAIDVRYGYKDFEGWTVDRKIDFFDEFQHILNETLVGAVASFIRDEDYKYYQALNWPNRTRPDSKNTLMFRGCLAHIIDVVGHIPQTIPPLINRESEGEGTRRRGLFQQPRLYASHLLSGRCLVTSGAISTPPQSMDHINREGALT